MEPPSLNDAQVHVWIASLCIEGTTLEHLYIALSDEERVRAERFRLPQHGRRFIAARAMLRRLLSAYLRTDPAAIHFGYGIHKKPFLINDSELRFNVSHAEDTAIVAIALRREVGVDIEATARDVDTDAIAQQWFSPLECESLMALAPSPRREAFFRIWTRKEAYVKALGEGLGYPTRSFSVSHRRNDDALIEDEREAEARHKCRLAEITAPEGFRAALAAFGRDWSLLQMTAPALSDRKLDPITNRIPHAQFAAHARTAEPEALLVDQSPRWVHSRFGRP